MGAPRKLLAIIVVPVALALAAWLAWGHSPEARRPAAASTPRVSTPGNASQARPLHASAAGTPAPINLFQQFQALRKRAQAGDPVAQRQLGDVYDACMNVNPDPEAYIARNTGSPYSDGRIPEDLLETLARERVEDCSHVKGEAEFPWQDAGIWHEKATQGGDLAARIRELHVVHNNGPSLDAEQAQRLFEEVVASQDPAAVYAYGDEMDGRLTENLKEPWLSLVEGRNANRAWRLAACRMGYDCGPQSMMYSNLCLHERACAVGSFEEVLRSGFISDEERKQIDPQLEKVMQVLEGTR